MNLLNEYFIYNRDFYNTDVEKRGRKKQLVISTNGTIDSEINHRIHIYSVVLKTELPIAFCCGSTWDSGPTGTHTITEYEEWLKTNPKWSAEIID